jgi:glycosyltransferase involved in cell wall biosynthesis
MEKPLRASTGKPELLFISPEAPWPMVGGGAMRTASLLEYLAKRFTVDLVLFAEANRDPAAALPGGLVRDVRTVRLPRHDRTLPAKFARNLSRYLRSRPPLLDRFSGFEGELTRLLADRHYSLGVIEHFWCAPYGDLLRRRCREVWLDLHNVESVWHERLAHTAGPFLRPALRGFAAASRKLERELLPGFSRILVPSKIDAGQISEAAGNARIAVYPNALPWIDLPAGGKDESIIFTGNLEYPPNVTAIKWFARQVWPRLREWRPGLVWRIVGTNPREIRRYIKDEKRVEVTGPVQNAMDELARARVAVVPVLAGSGTRFKVIEAWAAATPVVSTGIGVEGLCAEHGVNALIADSPEEMSEAIAGLLGSEQMAASVGSAGRRMYEERYTWENAWNALEQADTPC